MGQLLLFSSGIVLLLTTCCYGTEIELAQTTAFNTLSGYFDSRTEEELSWDDGDAEGGWGPWRLGMDYTAPYNCRVVRGKYYVHDLAGLFRAPIYDNDDSGPNDLPGTETAGVDTSGPTET